MTESSADSLASLMFMRLITPTGSSSSLTWMAKESSVGESSLSSNNFSTAERFRGDGAQLVRCQISGSPYHLGVEPVVRAGVAPQLDLPAFELSRSRAKSHGQEYTGFGGMRYVRSASCRGKYFWCRLQRSS